MTNDVKVVNKQCLRERARDNSLREPLPPKTIDRFLAEEVLEDPDIVVKVSRGSTANPPLIPRTRSDVGDIARRAYALLVKKTGNLPEYIALSCGISHSQAAIKLDLGTIRALSFQPGG